MAFASYSWALTDNLNGLLRADYAHTGTMRGTFRTTDPYFKTYGNYSTVSLHAGVEKQAGAVRLLPECDQRSGHHRPLDGLGFTNLSHSIQPRTIGINAKFGF